MSLLQDPKGLANGNLAKLDEKLRMVQMALSRPPKKGGSPFLYAFSSTRPHILADISEVVFTDEDGTEDKTYTAATDGKHLFWHPEKIARFSPFSLLITVQHENWHIVLQHCDIHRVQGKNRKIWNWAVDYVANYMIEHDYRQSGRISKDGDFKNMEHPIWHGDVGKPYYFKDLIAGIRKQKKALEKELKDLENGIIPKFKKPKRPQKEDFRKFADYSLYGRSAESIYEEIMKEFEGMSDMAISWFAANSGCGGGDDDQHITVDIPRSSLLSQILDAVMASKKLIGSAPAGAEDQLAKLSNPKLSWQDIVRVCFQAIRNEKGSINDWSRFRRRFVPYDMWIPKKKDEFLNWVAMLDTSGSMSREDMSYGVSQLKCLDGRSKGIVVPNDAMPYWDKMKDIYSMEDLPAINPCGRGGTMTGQFFEELHQKIRTPIDLVIVLTDGGIFDLDKLKKPQCDVLWVITSGFETFKPPFGRVAVLRDF